MNASGGRLLNRAHRPGVAGKLLNRSYRPKGLVQVAGFEPARISARADMTFAEGSPQLYQSELHPLVGPVFSRTAVLPYHAHS